MKKNLNKMLREPIVEYSVRELATGNWSVIAKGKIVVDGFATQAEAYRWIDRNSRRPSAMLRK